MSHSVEFAITMSEPSDASPHIASPFLGFTGGVIGRYSRPDEYGQGF